MPTTPNPCKMSDTSENHCHHGMAYPHKATQLNVTPIWLQFFSTAADAPLTSWPKHSV